MDGRGYWDALSVTGAGLPSSFAGPLSLIQQLLLTGVSSPANLVGPTPMSMFSGMGL